MRKNGNGKSGTDPSTAARARALKDAYLAALVEEEGMLKRACASVEIERQRPWAWRQDDPEFVAREQAAMDEGAKRAVERKRDERKELAGLGRTWLRRLLEMTPEDVAENPKLIHPIARAVEYVTKNDPDDPMTDGKQQVEHSGAVAVTWDAILAKLRERERAGAPN